jgi:alpha-glucosidase
LAAVWTEDWTGLKSFMGQTRLYWNWKANDERYPELNGFIKKLNDKGIKFLGYNNCFLMYDTPMYNEAAEKVYLVKDKDGKPYDLAMYSFSATMLDFTNP